MGIGLAVYVEPQTNVGAYATDPANIRMHPDGRVDVFIGSGAHGQGLETTTAQLVAENLGVDYADVTVRQGDTESAPFGPGTGGSRSGPMIGQAVTEASLLLREQGRRHRRAPARGVTRRPRGRRGRRVGEGHAHQVGAGRSRWRGPRTSSRARCRPSSTARSRSCTAASRRTRCGRTPPTAATSRSTPPPGKVEILRYVVSEDCGRMINPNIVDGQVYGGVAQGIGGVLYEHNVYDDDGNPLASTFMDYLLPTVHEIPDHRHVPHRVAGGHRRGLQGRRRGWRHRGARRRCSTRWPTRSPSTA